MAKENPITSMKQLTKIISDSSQKLLSAFLDDTSKEKKAHTILLNQIAEACKQQAFVVLQISRSTDSSQPIETITGHVKHNPRKNEMVIVTNPNNNTIHMIPIKHIKKISFLDKEKS